jgi:hypothetical protein
MTTARLSASAIPTSQASPRVAAEWRELERVSASSLSYEDFLARYPHAGRPVVVTGVAADWPAMAMWTPEHFKQRFGQKPVAVSYDRDMPFDTFIDQVLASSPETPGPYMFRSFLHEVLPELLPDLIPQNQFAYPRRHASMLMPEQWRRPDGYLKLLVGGVGSKFPVMHFDGENAHASITQIYGDKEFVVYAPEDTPYLYAKKHVPNHSMVDDPAMQDRERFPLLAKATQYRATLRPGDMVFVPAGWWHAARALTTSISVCTNMLDESNWDGFVAWVMRYSQLPPMRRRLLHLRLRSTGAVLDACEGLQRRAPGLARALVLPGMIAPLSAARAPEPSRRQIRVRIPTA